MRGDRVDLHAERRVRPHAATTGIHVVHRELEALRSHPMEAHSNFARVLRIPLEIPPTQTRPVEIKSWYDIVGFSSESDGLHLPGAQRVRKRQCPGLRQKARFDARLEVEGVVHDFEK